MADIKHSFELVLAYEKAPRRKYKYRERTDATGWWEVESVWTGCGWRIVGRDAVTSIAVVPVETKDEDEQQADGDAGV